MIKHSKTLRYYVTGRYCKGSCNPSKDILHCPSIVTGKIQDPPEGISGWIVDVLLRNLL